MKVSRSYCLACFKKVLIADNLSFFVQGGFSHPELFHGLDLWLFTYAFAFQIYFDFSGYTDIARGSAMLFGYKVPINFNLPYLASSIAEFWHRWHISLSTWLRDYLFIPLGGSRCSKWLNGRNLIITMTLGGLWHGAAMHYVLWGLYHGLLLMAHKMFADFRKSASGVAAFMESHIGKCLSVLVTFHAVCIGWVLFRAENIESCGQILSKMFFLDASPAPLAMALPAISYPLIYAGIYLILPVLAIAHIIMGRIDKTDFVTKSPLLLKAAWCVAMFLLIVILSPDRSPRFIYFQF